MYVCVYIYILGFPEIGVPPFSSILIGSSLIKQPFWGTLMTMVYIYIYSPSTSKERLVLVRPLRGDERLTELPQIPPEGARAPALASQVPARGGRSWGEQPITMVFVGDILN